MTVFFVGWMVTMIRFNCTNIDRNHCEAMCKAQGKEMSAIYPGILIKCYCVTDWLKKQKQEEELHKKLRNPIRP